MAAMDAGWLHVRDWFDRIRGIIFGDGVELYLLRSSNQHATDDGSGSVAVNIPTPQSGDLSSATLHTLLEQERPAAAVGGTHEEMVWSLYRAATEGNCTNGEKIFREDPNLITAQISPNKETALHVAALMGHTEFIKKLVHRMRPQELQALKFRDNFGRTALHNAAICGSFAAVEAFVKKEPLLTQEMRKAKITPLADAAYHDSTQVLLYLTKKTIEHNRNGWAFKGKAGGELIRCLTRSGRYDVCLAILDKFPKLAIERGEKGEGMLHSLAYKASDFRSGCELSFLQERIYPGIEVELQTSPSDREDRPAQPQRFEHDEEDPQVQSLVTATYNWIRGRLLSLVRAISCEKWVREEKYKHECTRRLVERACEQMTSSGMTQWQIMSYFSNPRPILHDAVENGAVDLIAICIQKFPCLIWMKDKKRHGNLFHSAVRLRQEKVVSLLLQENAVTKILANSVNKTNQRTALHLVAEIAPYHRLSSVSSPVLQLQRELKWFNLVEDLVVPTNREKRDSDSRTARELFTSEHKELLGKAEKWMRGTSRSCMLVSTLIATAVLAAAFGVRDSTFLMNQWKPFMVFIISDAAAFLYSASSIVVFLSILNETYAEQHFLHMLPRRLISGYQYLFLAIVAITVSFGATFYMIIPGNLRFRIIVPSYIVPLCYFPIWLFYKLHFPLLKYIAWNSRRPICSPKKVS